MGMGSGLEAGGAAHMSNQVLLVDKVRGRRRIYAQALAARGLGVLEMDDCFAAMSAVGRADFGGVIIFEEKRHLTMRGLCMLARKRHQGIALLVLHTAETEPQALQDTLGLAVHLMPTDASVEEVMDTLVRALQDRAHPAPNTGMVNLAVAMANAEAASRDSGVIPPVGPRTLGAPLSPAAGPPSAGVTPSAPRVLPTPSVRKGPTLTPAAMPAAPVTALTLDGALEDNSGAAVVMALFAQELTGRLLLEQAGLASGTYYFLRGEPVGCDFAGGDAGLWTRLVAEKLVADTPRPVVPEGQLLSVVAGQLTGDSLHAFLRTSVRGRLLALLSSERGSYRFEEDHTFLDVTPLLKFNPLGLVVEVMRKEVPPEVLMAESTRLEATYLHPLPALAAASRKMEPFLRGASALTLITGQGTLGGFCAQSKLGPIMGTLMALCMRRMNLLSMEDTPFQAGATSITLQNRVARDAADATEPAMQAPDADAEAAESAEDKDIRNAMFALYARIKPLTQPRAVLGVPPHAGLAEIRAAYDALMVRLDVRRLPEASAKGMVASRMEEVRQKVVAAYQALMLAEDMASPDNPF